MGESNLGTLRSSILKCAINNEVLRIAWKQLLPKCCDSNTCVWSFLLVQYPSSTIQTCFAQSEENIAPFTAASLLEAAAATNHTGLSFFKVTKMHNILHLPPEKQLPLQSFPIQGLGGVRLKESQPWSVTGLMCLYNHCTIKSKHIWQGWTSALYILPISKKYRIIASEIACLTITGPNKYELFQLEQWG